MGPVGCFGQIESIKRQSLINFDSTFISISKNTDIGPRIWIEEVLTKIKYYLCDEKDHPELLLRCWAKLWANQIVQNQNICLTGGLR